MATSKPKVFDTVGTQDRISRLNDAWKQALREANHQFGAELSRPGPTGFRGTPFIATNAHLREEVDFSGDWTLQTGWLWRGDTGSTLRMGLHYMNGKSTQYQFFNRNEEQIGLGLWCDF